MLRTILSAQLMMPNLYSREIVCYEQNEISFDGMDSDNFISTVFEAECFRYMVSGIERFYQ